MDHIFFFIHSSVDGHLGCFHVLAIVLLWTLGYLYLFELEFSSFPDISRIFFNEAQTAASQPQKTHRRGALGRTGSRSPGDETCGEKLSNLELSRGTCLVSLTYFCKWSQVIPKNAHTKVLSSVQFSFTVLSMIISFNTRALKKSTATLQNSPITT